MGIAQSKGIEAKNWDFAEKQVNLITAWGEVEEWSRKDEAEEPGWGQSPKGFLSHAKECVF